MQTKYIIAASVVLGLCSLTIMALITRILMHKHSKTTNEDVHITDGSGGHHHQLSHISSAWKRLFTPKREHPKGQWVPTLSGMIKGGDEGLVSSTLYANLDGRPGELSLQSLYEAFAEELRSRPMTDRSAYPGEIPGFLSNTKRVVGGFRREQSVPRRTTSRPGRPATAGSMKLSRMSLDISAAERGLVRSMSIKKSAPTTVSMGIGLPNLDKETNTHTPWTNDGQIARSRYDSIRVAITPAELAALSIILGSQLTIEKSDYTPSKKGAYNISILSSATEDGKHQIMLQLHERTISHMPAKGSGVSTLFAKHLAAGSLPYSQDKAAVHSVLITNFALNTVQSGSPLSLLESDFETRQSRYLSSLPSSRKLSFHITSPSPNPQPYNPLIDAISALPFVGGLAPLASQPLIDTVQFVASGGLTPGRLLKRLEGLVDKVNRQAAHLKIFGSLYEPQNLALLYRERERLGRIAAGANVADSVADKASRMQRYITLLERFMALVPDTQPQDVLAAVQEATKKELERSYLDAVAAHQTNPATQAAIVDTHGFPKSDVPMKRSSTYSHTSEYRSHRWSTSSVATVVSPSGDLQAQSLGKQVEQILKAELPLSIASIATVARLVIVAWTFSVETVAWEDGEEGFRVPELDKLPATMVMW
jgi:hypothetical protein